MTAIHGVRGGSRGEKGVDGRKITALRKQDQSGNPCFRGASLFLGRLRTGRENDQAPEDQTRARGRGGGQDIHDRAFSAQSLLTPMRSRKRVT